ncbi:MAG: TIGR00730 family Rossman fold protein [Wenzhouxiangella sp.]|jgi:uncharacterized protein (TIGR00730 family)|nr:TIGR00730 family Rossman fold protein [Wenzhouxiangella sp.]
MSIRRVTVYAASSQALHDDYIKAASRLGETLAGAGISIVYGGGGRGLMGAMADAAIARGGRVDGIIPKFLTRVERGHQGLASLEVVDTMRTRKERMLDHSDGVIALPGGCGTFEELFEVMTLKRLGQYLGPIVLVNTQGYYDGLMGFLKHSVHQRFMSPNHLDILQVVAEPEDVLDALRDAPAWSADQLNEAAVRAR